MSISRRDPRIDLLRGLALLVIFSDHITTNPLRNFTPISLGLSDMGEVFVFLSGYVNGVSHTPERTAKSFKPQVWKALVRCLRIYALLLLAQGFIVGAGLILHALGVSDVPRAVPRLRPGAVGSFVVDVLTLRSLIWTYAVLALYLLLIGSVPFLATLLRWRMAVVAAGSCTLYAAVQLRPHDVALPQPWANAVYFNPFAWQFLFVLGMAFGVGGQRCKRFLPTGIPTLVVALCVLEAAFLVMIGSLPQAYDLPWFAEAGNKATLGPLRLVHFFSAVVVGRRLFSRDLPVYKSGIARPLIVCGQHPLATYCVGGALSILGTWLLERHGTGWGWTAIVNSGGWTASVMTAYCAARSRRWYSGSASTPLALQSASARG